MARLIDTEKAWKTAQRIYSDPVLLHVIKNTLDSTDTVDAVKVVRCEDCKHRSAWDAFAECYWCNGERKTPEGFCNNGERRYGDG